MLKTVLGYIQKTPIQKCKDLNAIKNHRFVNKKMRDALLASRGAWPEWARWRPWPSFAYAASMNWSLAAGPAQDLVQVGAIAAIERQWQASGAMNWVFEV